MGLIRTLLIFFIVYVLFKVVIAPLLKPAPQTKKQKPHNQDNPQLDKMIPCPACGTYNASQSALNKNGIYFCNEDCYELLGDKPPEFQSHEKQS